MRADSKQLLEKHHSIFIIKVIIHDVKMEKKIRRKCRWIYEDSLKDP